MDIVGPTRLAMNGSSEYVHTAEMVQELHISPIYILARTFLNTWKNYLSLSTGKAPFISTYILSSSSQLFGILVTKGKVSNKALQFGQVVSLTPAFINALLLKVGRLKMSFRSIKLHNYDHILQSLSQQDIIIFKNVRSVLSQTRQSSPYLGTFRHILRLLDTSSSI